MTHPFVKIKSLLFQLITTISVEPVLFIHMAMFQFLRLFIFKLKFEYLGCHYIKTNYTVCGNVEKALHELPLAEAKLFLGPLSELDWLGNLTTPASLISALIFTTMSDRLKLRKPFLLLPIFWQLLTSLGCILCKVSEAPLILMGILDILFYFFGGTELVLTMVYTYISEITQVENRTFRMGLVLITYQLSVMAVNFTLFPIAYPWDFLLIAGCAIATILYCFMYLPPEEGPGTSETWHFKNYMKWDKIKELIVDNFKNLQAAVLIAMVMSFVQEFIVSGENSLIVENVSRMGWTETQELFFLTYYNGGVAILGGTVMLVLVTKVFQMEDTAIIIFAISAKILQNTCFTLSCIWSGWMFTGVLFHSLGFLIPACLNSMLSKIFSTESIGKIQIMLSFCHILRNFNSFALKLYQEIIYANTVAYFPTAFFLLSVALHGFLLLPLMIWLHIKNKRKSSLVVPFEKAPGSHDLSVHKNLPEDSGEPVYIKPYIN